MARKKILIPDEFLVMKEKEQRIARLASRKYVAAARAGDVELFQQATEELNAAIDGWRLAMRAVGRLTAVSGDIQRAFINHWIASKHLALKVGNRTAMARAARVLFPCDYNGTALRVYRGTSRHERSRRLYGFSWTTQRAIAQTFADQCSEEARKFSALPSLEGQTAHLVGVVLEAVAPASAILLMREEEGYYDEGEVVVDPFELKKVTVSK